MLQPKKLMSVSLCHSQMHNNAHTLVTYSDTCAISRRYSQSFCVLWYISWHVFEGKSMAVHSGACAGAVRRTRSRLTRQEKGAQQTPNPQTTAGKHQFSVQIASPDRHLQTKTSTAATNAQI